MKLKINTYIKILSAVLFMLVSCNAQQKQQEPEKVSLLHTDWERYNLKGKIKELKTTYERFYPDTIPIALINRYERRNDMDLIWRLPTGYHLFSKFGFLTKQQDRYQDTLFIFNVLLAKRDRPISIYIYDTLDINEKRKIKGKHKHLFPLHDPYNIKVNIHKGIDVIKLYGDNSVFIDEVYEYTFDINNKISEEKYFMGSDNWDYKDFHYRRKAYSYNENYQVNQVDVFFRENSEPLTFDFINLDHLWMMDIPARSSMRYEYDYDNEERITETRFKVEGTVVWRESYRYPVDSRVPNELDRFIISANTHGVFLTDNATEWYNEHADIIKVEYYDKEGNVVHTRFYDYEYDEQNNWVECRMYLEGLPERTENPTRIARRTITYYPELEVKKD